MQMLYTELGFSATVLAAKKRRQPAIGLDELPLLSET